MTYITFTFSHQGDGFSQSNLQTRAIEVIKETKEQQYVNTMVIPS